MSDELRPVAEDWSHGTVQATARIQERIYWDGDILTEFCVQLEYNTNAYLTYADADWYQVARFDHNVADDQGHDIREEGLHLDVYNKHGKEYVETNFGTPPLQQAPKICRDYLERNHDDYLAEFERRIGVPKIFRFYDS